MGVHIFTHAKLAKARLREALRRGAAQRINVFPLLIFCDVLHEVLYIYFVRCPDVYLITIKI
jgi:hypothetical protein